MTTIIIIICVLLAVIAVACMLIYINIGHILDCYIDVNQDILMRRDDDDIIKEENK